MTEVTKKAVEQIQWIADYLISKRTTCHDPLFVIGAGVSEKLVPMMSEIGSWFFHELSNSQEQPKNRRLVSHADSLKRGCATRREVAELFSQLQGHVEDTEHDPILDTIWTDFSRKFLIDGLDISGKQF